VPTAVDTAVPTAVDTAVPTASPTTVTSAVSLVDLGTAGNYGVLSSTFTCIGGTTAITGDAGYTTVSGVHTVTGTNHTTPTQAGSDQAAALVSLNNMACTYTFPTGAVDLAADTTHGSIGVYTPGVYCSDAAMNMVGNITLNGKGIYIFRAAGALNTTANSIVSLTGGAELCDVFWTPAGATTLGATSTFIGTVIDDIGITVGNAVSWSGRALAYASTVSMDTDNIAVPVCAAAATATVTQTSSVTSTNTATVTKTVTATVTLTCTQTITPTRTMTGTSTITPTRTVTGTPTIILTATPVTDDGGIAYPNPAKQGGEITMTYQPKAGATVDKAEAVIYSINGDKVLSAVENTYRNGFIRFQLANLAPGVYLYRVTATYTDGSKESFKIKKFAVVKSGVR
jgi:type VI secretion system secreted protein VgrG